MQRRTKTLAAAAMLFAMAPNLAVVQASGPGGPLDEVCSGLKRFGPTGLLSPDPPTPGLAHQGPYYEPDTKTVALFVLEDEWSSASDQTRGGRDRVWYIMSGTTGIEGDCEEVVCPMSRVPLERVGPVPENLPAFMDLVAELEFRGCI